MGGEATAAAISSSRFRALRQLWTISDADS